MDSLVRSLKEMDPNTFQQFCFQLMAEKYPSANVRYVEGASGDEGLDLFCGDLTAGQQFGSARAFKWRSLVNLKKNKLGSPSAPPKKALRRAVGCYAST